MTRPTVCLPWLPCLLLVSSCSSPPKPPSVDESRKRPANIAMAVELQACRSDLENTRVVAAESVRNVEASSLAMSEWATRMQQEMFVRSVDANSSSRRNLLVSLQFAFGSTQVLVPDGDASRIVDEARSAPLVVLRGRTDGAVESPAESGIARGRAAAVEAWLVQAGVDRARIRTTWQPVGDHAADNSTPDGRSLNRRVEIEIYRVAPIVAAAANRAAATAGRSAEAE